MIGVCVVDCWKAYRLKFGSKMTVCQFAEQVAYELLHNSLSTTSTGADILSPIAVNDRRSSPRRAILVDNNDEDGNVISPLISRNS